MHAADPYLRQHCSFARINIDRAKPLVRQLGISKIPTVLLLAPDGSTLNNFRASGQAARDAITQQLAAMQQQQQQQQPSLPVLPPESAAGGDQEQPAPSEVEGNGSSTAGATCGTAPEPTCGQLPPGVALPDSSAAMPDTNSSSPGVLSAAPGSNADSQPGNSSSSSAVPADPALAAAKAQFLQQYGSGYGYAGGWLDQHYQGEVGSRLGPNKHYLDYTGILTGSCHTTLLDLTLCLCVLHPSSSAPLCLLLTACTLCHVAASFRGQQLYHSAPKARALLCCVLCRAVPPGAALYPASLLEAVYKDLLTHSYGNPHSVGAPAAADSTVGSSSAGSSSGAVAAAAVAAPPAAASEAVMEAAAAAVLQHLHADPAEYQVVFTRCVDLASRTVLVSFLLWVHAVLGPDVEASWSLPCMFWCVLCGMGCAVE
jgi:hypothetical protein